MKPPPSFSSAPPTVTTTSPSTPSTPPPARHDVPHTDVSLHDYVDAVIDHHRHARFRHHARRALVAVALLAVLFGAAVFGVHRLHQRLACHDHHGVYVDGVCLDVARIDLP